jgi:phosphoglycolate phosphatase
MADPERPQRSQTQRKDVLVEELRGKPTLGIPTAAGDAAWAGRAETQTRLESPDNEEGGSIARVIMFDYDGVIVDSLRVFGNACAKAFRAAGLPQFGTVEAILTLHEQNWFAALAAVGIPEATGQEIENAAARACEQADLRPFPGVREVIATLSKTSTLIVVTSSRARVVEAFLASHRIAGVSRIMGSDGETSKVAKMAAVRAEFGEGRDYWYVGDTVGDIVEAKEADVHTIATSWGWHSATRLLEAHPEYLVDEPAELLSILNRHHPFSES